jgi:hypothetical protein
MKFLNHIFNKHRPMAVSILSVLLFVSLIKVFASGPFAPGTQLDPNCTPGSGGCTVSAGSQWTTTGSDIYFNTGKVGIGTASPDSIFHIEKNVDDQVIGKIVNTNGGVNADAQLGALADSAQVYLTAFSSTEPSPFYAGRGGILSTKSLLLVSEDTGNSIIFGHDSTEQMRIDGDTGNVGIGTANPDNLLQVAGLINFDGANFNTFIGSQSGAANTTGATNVALGNGTLTINDSGSDNTAVGNASLTNNTSGGQNSALGSASLINNTEGSLNTAVGDLALFSNTTGIRNIGIGYAAGYNNTTSSDQLFIDDRQRTSDATEALIYGLFDDIVENQKLTVNGRLHLKAMSAAPSTPAPTAGDMYYDSDNQDLCIYNGTSWHSTSGGACT